MNLNDEQKQYCIDAGKYGFNAKKLAALLMLPVEVVKKSLSDPSSEIFNHYEHGKAVFMVEPFKALEQDAAKGNYKAARALIELKKELQVQQMTDEFLGR